MSRQTIQILGVTFDTLSYREAEQKLEELMKSSHKALICTPNTEFVIKAQSDDDFREIINKKSKLNLADSFGLLWAARFLSLPVPKNITLRYLYTPLLWLFSILLIPFIPKSYKSPIKDKVSGSDFIWSISRFAADRKLRIFLFGGAPTVAERAALKLQTDVYGLRVAGVFPGDLTRPNTEILEAINKSRADILLVCLGAPRQEKWLAENLSKTCCQIGVGLGGTFDFTASIVPRAPYWMQRSGLEWLFRLIIEPKRIVRQVALPKFAWLVLKEKIRRG